MFRFTSPPMPHYITSGEDTYAAGGKHPDRASIGVFDLLVVTRGALYLAEDGAALTVGANQFAILRPDRAHKTVIPCREETHFYWLHFQTLGSWSVAAEREPRIFLPASDPHTHIESFVFHVPRFGELHAREGVFERLQKLLQLHSDFHAAARFRQQTLLLELLLQLQEESSSAAAKDPQLALADEAAAFLRRNYREQLSYKELSDQLHFHANYIALCMKKAFGCTPQDYLTRYRIEQAKQLLIHTGEPIGKIAEETGFQTFPYFVRCFSKHAGARPKEFRLRYR